MPNVLCLVGSTTLSFQHFPLQKILLKAKLLYFMQQNKNDAGVYDNIVIVTRLVLVCLSSGVI